MRINTETTVSNNTAFQSLIVKPSAKKILLKLDVKELENLKKEAKELNKTKFYDLKLFGYESAGVEKLGYIASKKDPNSIHPNLHGPFSYSHNGKFITVMEGGCSPDRISVFYKNEAEALKKYKSLDNTKSPIEKAIKLTKMIDRQISDEQYFMMTPADQIKKKSSKELQKELDIFYESPMEEMKIKSNIIDELISKSKN